MSGFFSTSFNAAFPAVAVYTVYPSLLKQQYSIEDSDKIKGFSIGADDYVIKPFSVDELEARIAAHLRREKRHNTSSKVQFDEDMVIDYSSRIVFYHNKDMAFTKKEFDIISFLSQNKGIVFDRETIYEKVWGLDGIGDKTQNVRNNL